MAGMNRIPIAIDDNPADTFFIDLDATFEGEISIELVPNQLVVKSISSSPDGMSLRPEEQQQE
jgi:hypothetical protein